MGVGTEVVPIESVEAMGVNWQCVREDQQIFVVLKPLCEALGIQFSAQLKRAKRMSGATVSKKDTVGADGKNRLMETLDLKSIPLWIGGISVNAVRESIRTNLKSIQEEIREVLARHFFGPKIVNQIDPAMFVAMQAQIASVQKMLCDYISRETARRETLPEHVAVAPVGREYSINDRLDYLGYEVVSGNPKSRLRNYIRTVLSKHLANSPDAMAANASFDPKSKLSGELRYNERQVRVVDMAIRQWFEIEDYKARIAQTKSGQQTFDFDKLDAKPQES